MVVDLKQSTEAKHETRDGIDDVLIDRHCDQHKNLKLTGLYLIYLYRPVTLTDDEFGKVIRSLSFVCLEGKVNFAWFVEIIPRVIVVYEEIPVCLAVSVSNSNIVIGKEY